MLESLAIISDSTSRTGWMSERRQDSKKSEDELMRSVKRERESFIIFIIRWNHLNSLSVTDSIFGAQHPGHNSITTLPLSRTTKVLLWKKF